MKHEFLIDNIIIYIVKEMFNHMEVPLFITKSKLGPQLLTFLN